MRPKIFVLLAAMTTFISLSMLGAQMNTAASGKSETAQQATASGVRNVSVTSGTKMYARLLTTINAKKAKPGQRVVAKVIRPVKQHGRTIIRKNARLIGRITSVQASGKGRAGSQIGITFDRLFQGGTTTQMATVVTSIVSSGAVLAPEPMQPDQPMAPMGPAAPMGRAPSGGRGGLLGGGTGAVGGTLDSSVNAGVRTVGGAGNQGMNAAGDAAAGTANGIMVSNNILSSGNTAAGVSKSAGGANVGAFGSTSNQTAATSFFSRRHGNVQLYSGAELQFETVASAEQPRQRSR